MIYFFCNSPVKQKFWAGTYTVTGCVVDENENHKYKQRLHYIHSCKFSSNIQVQSKQLTIVCNFTNLTAQATAYSMIDQRYIREKWKREDLPQADNPNSFHNQLSKPVLMSMRVYNQTPLLNLGKFHSLINSKSNLT